MSPLVGFAFPLLKMSNRHVDGNEWGHVFLKDQYFIKVKIEKSSL